MAAAIGIGGASGIGAVCAASSSTADVGSLVGGAVDDSADLQKAIWSPTELDDQALTDLLQAMQAQSPAAATPTSFGP